MTQNVNATMRPANQVYASPDARSSNPFLQLTLAIFGNICNNLRPFDRNALLLTDRSIRAFRPLTHEWVKIKLELAAHSLITFLELPPSDPRVQEVNQALSRFKLQSYDEMKGVILCFLFQLDKAEFKKWAVAFEESNPSLDYFTKVFSPTSQTVIHIRDWKEGEITPYVFCQNIQALLTNIFSELIDQRRLVEAKALAKLYRPDISPALWDKVFSSLFVHFMTEKRVPQARDAASQILSSPLKNHYLAYLSRSLCGEKNFTQAIATANRISSVDKQREIITAIFKHGILKDGFFDRATQLCESLPSEWLKDRLFTLIAHFAQDPTQSPENVQRTPFEQKCIEVERHVRALDYLKADEITRGEIAPEKRDLLLKILAIGCIELGHHQNAVELGALGSQALQNSIARLVKEFIKGPFITFKSLEDPW